MASTIYHPGISQEVKGWSNLWMKTSDIRRARLAQIIASQFNGVAAELALKIGRDASYISRIFTQKAEHRRNIGEDLARDIEIKLGLAPGSLDDSALLTPVHMLNESMPTYANIAPTRPVSNQSMVPVISWVLAGQWCEAIDNFAPGDSDDWLPCPVFCGPRTYALRVVGDSMTSPYPHERSYPEGVTIFVDPDKSYENGSRVIAKVPATNEVTFKKLVMDSGRVFLRPLNPAYPTIDITSEMHICGVIIGSFSAE